MQNINKSTVQTGTTYSMFSQLKQVTLTKGTRKWIYQIYIIYKEI